MTWYIGYMKYMWNVTNYIIHNLASVWYGMLCIREIPTVVNYQMCVVRQH